MSEPSQNEQRNNINLIRQKLQEIETTLDQINNRLTKLERTPGDEINQEQVQRSGRQFFDLKSPEPKMIDPFGRPTEG